MTYTSLRLGGWSWYCDFDMEYVRIVKRGRPLIFLSASEFRTLWGAQRSKERHNEQ